MIVSQKEKKSIEMPKERYKFPEKSTQIKDELR